MILVHLYMLWLSSVILDSDYYIMKFKLLTYSNVHIDTFTDFEFNVDSEIFHTRYTPVV